MFKTVWVPKDTVCYWKTKRANPLVFRVQKLKHQSYFPKDSLLLSLKKVPISRLTRLFPLIYCEVLTSLPLYCWVTVVWPCSLWVMAALKFTPTKGFPTWQQASCCPKSQKTGCLSLSCTNISWTTAGSQKQRTPFRIRGECRALQQTIQSYTFWCNGCSWGLLRVSRSSILSTPKRQHFLSVLKFHSFPQLMDVIAVMKPANTCC